MGIHYGTLTKYYDQRFREMLMIQYSGRQRTYDEAVKFFIGGSKKYGPRRHVPLLHPAVKQLRKDKYRKATPKDPDKKRVIIAFGDASINNMRGTLPISIKRFLHHLRSYSKRLGRFTARDQVDFRLIGKKKLEIVMIPEYLTSQVLVITWRP